MPTQAKTDLINQLAEKLQKATITVLVKTEGLSAKDTVDLRHKMRAAQVELQVAKNTLLRIASERNEMNLDPEFFHDQTTVAFGYDDEVAAAKAVNDYVQNSKVVVIKSAILGGRTLTTEQVEGIAKIKGGKLQSKAEVVGTIQSPLAATYGVLTAPLRDLAYVFQARADQLNAGGENA